MKESATIVADFLSMGYRLDYKHDHSADYQYIRLRHVSNGNVISVAADRWEIRIRKNGRLVKTVTAYPNT